jgi:hypothetical protein
MTISTTRVSESGDRDECVLIAMKRSEAMLRGYAMSHELDFEDLYQDCAELMLRVWVRMPADVTTKVGYLYGVARLEMRLVVKRLDKESLHPISIDVPLFGDDEPETLKDIIPDTRQVQDDDRVDLIIETMHEALHECLIDEQEHAKEYYELNAFTPMQTIVRRDVGCKPFAKVRHPHNMRDSMKRVLRRNPHVLKLVQRETCVL